MFYNAPRSRNSSATRQDESARDPPANQEVLLKCHRWTFSVTGMPLTQARLSNPPASIAQGARISARWSRRIGAPN